MTDATGGALAPQTAAERAAPLSNLYRAVWRWHFYAGLLVLPFMISLAVTGAIYLYHTEIDRWVHADFMRVTPQAQALPPSQLVAAALTAQPGTALKYTDPASDDASTEITIQPKDGPRMAAFIDPYTAKVLEVRADRSTIGWTVRKLHSLSLFGATPRMIIEIVAGWSILLVLTGIYLWWPRGQKGALSVRGTPKRRVFWRDLHAVTGIFAGFFIIFLALTGMPWSSVWGGKVNEWANGRNFGYPAGLRIDVPMSDEHLNHVAKTSWSLEQAQIPKTMPMGAPINLDTAVETFTRLGLHRGFSVALPQGPEGVYSGSVYPDDLSQQRVIHLDQYSNTPLIDISYADYGPLGRGLEWGDQHPYGPDLRHAEQDHPVGGLRGHRDAGGQRGRDVVEAAPLGQLGGAAAALGPARLRRAVRSAGHWRAAVPADRAVAAGDDRAGSDLAMDQRRAANGLNRDS